MTLIIPALNRSWLNRTPSKTARPAKQFRPEFVVMHETGGSGTLAWNVRPEVQASFNYLITYSGTIYHYVDEAAWIAWHAGIRSQWILEGREYSGSDLNVWSIGVEIEGKNDYRDVIRPAQTRSALNLMYAFNQWYGIPLEYAYYPEHKDVAPGYKHDATAYSSAILVDLARAELPATHTRRYVYHYTGKCRTAPTTNSSVALDGAAIYSAGYEFDGYVQYVKGQSLGGNPWWVHWADERGFTHTSIIAPV